MAVAVVGLLGVGCSADGREQSAAVADAESSAQGDATVVHVVDGDTFDVGQLLVRAGLARWVPRYADEDPRLAAMYEDAERQARDGGAGLWSSCGWS